MAEQTQEQTDLDGDLNVAELGSGGDGDLAGAQAVRALNCTLCLQCAPREPPACNPAARVVAFCGSPQAAAPCPGPALGAAGSLSRAGSKREPSKTQKSTASMPKALKKVGKETSCRPASPPPRGSGSARQALTQRRLPPGTGTGGHAGAPGCHGGRVQQAPGVPGVLLGSHCTSLCMTGLRASGGWQISSGPVNFHHTVLYVSSS